MAAADQSQACAPPMRELLRTTLLVCVEATLSLYRDRTHGGFFHSATVSSRDPSRLLVSRASKSLEDNALICWSLLSALDSLPEALASECKTVSWRCLDLLFRRMALPESGMAISAGPRWGDLSREIHSEGMWG